MYIIGLRWLTVSSTWLFVHTSGPLEEKNTQPCWSYILCSDGTSSMKQVDKDCSKCLGWWCGRHHNGTWWCLTDWGCITNNELFLQVESQSLARERWTKNGYCDMRVVIKMTSCEYNTSNVDWRLKTDIWIWMEEKKASVYALYVKCGERRWIQVIKGNKQIKKMKDRLRFRRLYVQWDLSESGTVLYAWNGAAWWSLGNSFAWGVYHDDEMLNQAKRCGWG